MFSIQSWFSGLRQSNAGGLEAGPVIGGTLFRFAAMPKLVDERELAELGRQAGFDARLLRKLRVERRRAYRLYLAELVEQFRIFEKEALDRAANDPGVDPGFAEQVLKAKARFAVSVWLLRASLWLPSVTLPKTYKWTVDLVAALKPGNS